MVLEIAAIEIIPGHEEAFEAGVRAAHPLFARARGCQRMSLRRVVENRSRYLLVIEWDTLEDHTITFRQSEDFVTWRRLVAQHFSGPPVVEHSDAIDIGGGR